MSQSAATTPWNSNVCRIFTVGLDFAQRDALAIGGVQERGEPLDPKLAMLIVLFGVIIALSHLSTGQVERMRERIALRRRRKNAPVTDEI
jgi:hypothetical protein